MIRPGFLDSASRRDLIDLARDGSAAHRLARRANALVGAAGQRNELSVDRRSAGVRFNIVGSKLTIRQPRESDPWRL